MKESREDIEKILHFQDLLSIFKIIYIKLISLNYNKSFTGYFGIEKT